MSKPKSLGKLNGVPTIKGVPRPDITTMEQLLSEALKEMRRQRLEKKS